MLQPPILCHRDAEAKEAEEGLLTPPDSPPDSLRLQPPPVSSAGGARASGLGSMLQGVSPSASVDHQLSDHSIELQAKATTAEDTVARSVPTNVILQSAPRANAGNSTRFSLLMC